MIEAEVVSIAADGRVFGPSGLEFGRGGLPFAFLCEWILGYTGDGICYFRHFSG